jgi:hypothetical protein
MLEVGVNIVDVGAPEEVGPFVDASKSVIVFHAVYV